MSNESKFDIVKCDSKTLSFGISTISIVLVLIIVFVVYKTYIKPIDFEIPEDDENLSYNRQVNRGMLSGLITAIAFGTANVVISTNYKINLEASNVLLTLLLGNTIGFLTDNSIATDDGLRNFQNNGYVSGIRSMFSSLVSGRFFRFGLTVLIDTFLALIFLKPAYEWLIQQNYFKCNNFTKSVANGLLAALLGLITFNAYSNQNRIYWKNPDLKLADRAMPNSTIILSNIVLLFIFLKSRKGNNEKLTNSKVKLLIVYIVLCLISIGYMSDVASNNFPENLTQKISNMFSNVPRHILGKIIFSIISFICVFGTFATSKMGNEKWIVAALITGLLCLYAFTDGFGSIINYCKQLLGYSIKEPVDLNKETTNIINDIQNQVNNELKKEIDN